MKKAASSPSLPKPNLSVRSRSSSPQPIGKQSSPQQTRKQSWYANLRQKTFKKSNHNCKVKCARKAPKHKCKYLYDYYPGDNDYYLLCIEMLEPCVVQRSTSNNRTTQKNSPRQAVYLGEPLGSCYVSRKRKKKKSKSNTTKSVACYNYDPAIGDEPYALRLSEVTSTQHACNAVKPSIISDVRGELDAEHAAIVDLIELVKTRRKNTKRIMDQLRYGTDTNENVILCSDGTECQVVSIQDNTLTMQGSDTSVNPMSKPEITKPEQVPLHTNDNINMKQVNDKSKWRSNQSNNFLTRRSNKISDVNESTVIDNEDKTILMQELDHVDAIDSKRGNTKRPTEGSIYSDCYLSSAGVMENFDYNGGETKQLNSLRKDISPNQEVQRRRKRLKMLDPNEAITELDVGGLVVDRMDLSGVSDAGSEDGKKEDEEGEPIPGDMSSFYSYHVAASLVNNTSAIMLLVDHKM